MKVWGIDDYGLDEAKKPWRGGDPCASCGSTETEWNWLEGGSCRSCGKGDSDD